MEQPNYYGILPANVRYDKELKPMEKIMYTEITALASKNGYCNASNSYFAELYDVHKNTVGDWINKLKSKGYLKVVLIYKEGTKQVKERRIYIDTPINKKIDTYQEKDGEGINKKIDTPINKKTEGNNTSINNTRLIIKENIKRKIFEELDKENLDDTLREKIKEWVEYRSMIKKPLKTYRPISLILKSNWIQKSNAIDFIDWCMNHEWQGLEDKFYDSYCKEVPTKTKYKTGADYAKEVEEFYASNQ